MQCSTPLHGRTLACYAAVCVCVCGHHRLFSPGYFVLLLLLALCWLASSLCHLKVAVVLLVLLVGVVVVLVLVVVLVASPGEP